MMKLYKNVCIVDTVYALLLYLLKMDLKDINQTFFFVGYAIDDNICDSLPKCVRFSTQRPLTWKELLLIRLKKISHWPFIFLRNVDIYAQDHLFFSDILIGSRKYTLIEDSHGVFKNIDSGMALKPFTPNKGDSMKSRIKYILSHARIHGNISGTNDQCICRWITDENDIKSKYCYMKHTELLSIKQLWDGSSTEKKEYIKQVFGVSNDLIKEIRQTKLIIFTQAFMEDCNLTENEMFDIYRPYALSSESVAFKIHSRDHFDYRRYFPNVRIINTNAPMQLLNLLDAFPSSALTVSSSALSLMPNTVKKIFLGTKINMKIFNVSGDCYNS